MERYYYVRREILVWEYVAELGRNVWVTVSAKQVTPNRKAKEPAEMDFSNLGFEIIPGRSVQCNDNIIPGESWVRYIVQRKTIY